MTEPLSRSRSRILVALLVAMMLALAVFATIVITRGWDDEKLQDHIEQLEADGNN